MTLARAKALLAHDPHAARDLARQASPGIEARFIVAAALRRCGDPAGALAGLEPLAAATAWGPHYERGAALAMLGRHGEACAALHRALALNPSAGIAAHALAGELVLAGEPPEPRTAQACAAIHHPDGPFVRAALAGEPLPGFDPGDPCWLRLLADAARAAGGEDRAEQLLRAALERAPGFAAATFDLAALLEGQQRGPEAVVLLAPLARACPGNVAVQALFGAAQLHAGAVGGAIAASDAALAVAPQDAALWHARGHVLRVAGRQAEAIAAYRRALALAPDEAEPWWSLANLKTGTLTGEDRAAMTGLLAQGPPPRQAAHLHFALGHAALDAGEPAAAMAHLDAANALRRRNVPFDEAEQARFVAAATGRFDPAFFAARAGWGDPRPGPVFIVGLPRSGSTLVEQILASHPAVEGLSELPDLTLLARQLTGRLIAEGRAGDRASAVAALTAAEARALGEAYLARVAPHRRLDRPLFIDKAPGNVWSIALIRLALPGARIIDVRREAMACCFSLYAQDFAAGQGYSYDQALLGRTYRRYVQLADHFAQILGDGMIRVSHEDVLADLPGTVDRLLRLCGLPPDEACLRFHANPRAVRTISSEQVRQPLDPARAARWQACAPWLGPLAAALAGEDDKKG